LYNTDNCCGDTVEMDTVMCSHSGKGMKYAEPDACVQSKKYSCIFTL